MQGVCNFITGHLLFYCELLPILFRFILYPVSIPAFITCYAWGIIQGEKCGAGLKGTRIGTLSTVRKCFSLVLVPVQQFRSLKAMSLERKLAHEVDEILKDAVAEEKVGRLVV